MEVHPSLVALLAPRQVHEGVNEKAPPDQVRGGFHFTNDYKIYTNNAWPFSFTWEWFL